MLHNVVQENILQKFEASRVKRIPLSFIMAIVEDVELNVYAIKLIFEDQSLMHSSP